MPPGKPNMADTLLESGYLSIVGGNLRRSSDDTLFGVRSKPGKGWNPIAMESRDMQHYDQFGSQRGKPSMLATYDHSNGVSTSGGYFGVVGR